MADYKPEKNYVVTGAYATVKTATTDGVKVVGLYAGSPWPKDATQEAGQHHLDTGLIAEIGVPAERPPQPGTAPVTPIDPETATVPETTTAQQEADLRRAQAEGAEETRQRAFEIQGTPTGPAGEPVTVDPREGLTKEGAAKEGAAKGGTSKADTAKADTARGDAAREAAARDTAKSSKPGGTSRTGKG